jgi:hypothetical protein
MKTFEYVEDYLEVIAGKRQLASGLLSPISLFASFTPLVNLARYDVNFLDNVTDQTTSGNALTDRQAELAIKLIQKYKRQLLTHNIDIDAIDPPRYRKSLRILDRTKKVELIDGAIRMRFPYESKLIESIRDESKESQGRIHFDRDVKLWKVALTEYNLNWACEFARLHGFEIDKALQDHMANIVACEQSEFKIELVQTDNGFAISNASGSLVEYINAHGGFGLDNTVFLADMCSVLGYTLSAEVEALFAEIFTASDALLLYNRSYDFNTAPDTIGRIVSYAQLTNRYPIVTYNPNPDGSLVEWQRHFAPEEILVVKNQKHSDVQVLPQHKLIYSSQIIRSLEHIPLLVSQIGMIVGSSKQTMVTVAEKIFYTQMKLG